MRMRITAVLKLVALAAIALIAVSGCDLLDGLFGPDPVTVAQRIQSLEDELNKADRSETYLLFHEGLTADYNAIKDPEFWEIPFPVPLSGEAYVLSNIDSANTADVRITIDGPAAFGGPKDHQLVLAQDADENWMIRTLSISDGLGAWTEVVK